MSEKIIELLRHFGFSVTDAEIYLFLLLQGHKRARDIASTLIIPTNTVYQSLRRLENKKAITVKRENNKIFFARSIEEITKEQIDRKKAQANDLAKCRKKFYKASPGTDT